MSSTYQTKITHEYAIRKVDTLASIYPLLCNYAKGTPDQRREFSLLLKDFQRELPAFANSVRTSLDNDVYQFVDCVWAYGQYIERGGTELAGQIGTVDHAWRIMTQLNDRRLTRFAPPSKDRKHETLPKIDTITNTWDWLVDLFEPVMAQEADKRGVVPTRKGANAGFETTPLPVIDDGSINTDEMDSAWWDEFFGNVEDFGLESPPRDEEYPSDEWFDPWDEFHAEMEAQYEAEEDPYFPSEYENYEDDYEYQECYWDVEEMFDAEERGYVMQDSVR